MASVDDLTLPFMLTKSMHRDVYPAIDPAANETLIATSKVVMVFGATGGLGFAVAKSWSIAKAKAIVLVGRDMASLQKAKTDLASDGETDAVFKQALEELGHVDVVVNTFGAVNVGPVGKLDPAAWWQNFEVNVKAVFNASHSYITAAGGKGTIIDLLAAIKLGEYLDAEQPELRVFSVHPGIVIAENGRGSVHEEMLPFTKDTPALTGGLTLYLATPDADFLKGGYIHANWDVRELAKHKEEIIEKKLVKLAFLNGQLQPGGHPWSS